MGTIKINTMNKLSMLAFAALAASVKASPLLESAGRQLAGSDEINGRSWGMCRIGQKGNGLYGRINFMQPAPAPWGEDSAMFEVRDLKVRGRFFDLEPDTLYTLEI